MYNGIGLATARGSGTNGYVVKNLSVITRHPRPQTYTAEVQDQPDLLPYRKPDEGILLHEKKRQIEVQCLELQLQLEDQGLADEETMMQVDKLRVKLFRALEEGKEQKPIKVLKPSDTHQLAHAKKFENTKMMRALGISESNYVEGAAFDRERKLREKMLRENEIELEKARMLQNAKLNQGLGSDSDSSETDSKRKRHHKKSKSKRKEKRRQESPLTQTRSFKEIASQTQPFVHPSRRHLQPNSPDKNLEATRHSRDLGLDGHSHKHSDVHQNDRSLGYSGRSPSHRFKSQFCELNSGNKAKGSSSRSSSRDRVAKRSTSRSPRRGRSRGRTSRRFVPRSPMRDGLRGRTTKRSVSRSPVRAGRDGRSFRSPFRSGDRGRTNRHFISRSPIRDGLRGRTSRRSVSRSPIDSDSRSRSSGLSVSRSPVRSKFRNRGLRRSVTRSPVRFEVRKRSGRRSASRSLNYSSSRSPRRSRARSNSSKTSSCSVSRSLDSASGRRRLVRDVSRSPICRR